MEQFENGFNKSNLKIARQLIDQKLAELMEETGLELKIGGISFDPNGTKFTTTLTVKTQVDGKSAEEMECEEVAPKLGLPSNIFGKKFMVKGQEFEIIGLKPLRLNPKNNLFARFVGTDSNYKMSHRILEGLELY